ncbi:hypothetical protein L6164_021741 [Bauhinia variegata]|uniref:Uncharacterized protein n=1 Tax=Bauhinia variegata TaxID=167791 RepID=A0ACB9MCX0_BAUVA|nr:hypothetical protein L6164_021741 [Bauhinia variegata]
MASKSRSSLSETPNKSATPRISKLSKGVSKSEPESPSPLQNSRPSAEPSPRSVNSKPSVDRKSPRLSTPGTPTDKQIRRVAKGSDLQAQLNLAQEDLKKVKEQLIQAEKEKAKASDELKEAQRVAEEANEKLREALVAQKRAEEDSEIEKFRAVELEQAGIEAAKKREEEWEKEVESVRNQHASDVAALMSTTQELQRVKQELTMICDAKNQALSHADDATRFAEIHAEKAEILSAELAQLKTLLDSKLEMEASENKIILKLRTEIDTLKQELEKGKGYEEKLMEKETSIEQLNIELEAARMAESYAHSLLEEWKKKVEVLEMSVEEANKLERSASESLESVMKQVKENNDLLHGAESEIATLKEKVGLLEMTIGRKRGDLEDSEQRLLMAEEENSEISKKVESLQAELEAVKEEKSQALNNEKLAASSVQTLLEEKSKLINELENSREEEEKSKKAMESLASALHEVSAESREAKEKLLNNQVEHQSYETQIEDLKLVVKATDEKYVSMLDDAMHEIDLLRSSIEKSKNDFDDSKAEWEERELHLVNCLKQTEEENSSMGEQMNYLVNLLKEAEEKVSARKEEEAQLKESLKEVEAEAIHLQEALKEAKSEGVKLKESLVDKENELQSIFQENEELRTRESVSIKKVEELSKLLEEATSKNQSEENGDVTESEREYDLLPKVVEFSEENGHGGEEVELSTNGEKSEEAEKVENANGRLKEEKEDDSLKMWESCKIEKKEFSPSPEREAVGESFEEEVESTEKVDDEDPSKQKEVKKKKKALLGKFGSLLKKKGATATSN